MPHFKLGGNVNKMAVANPTMEFDAVPVAVEFDAVPVDDFDAIPVDVDPAVVQQEAMKATTGAKQALGVMRAPQSLDSPEENEKTNWERSNELQALKRVANDLEREGPSSEWDKARKAVESKMMEINPDSEAGRAEMGEYWKETQSAQNAGIRRANQSAGLMSTGKVIANSAMRNLVPATGGGLGAAAFLVPGGGLARMALSLAGGFMGAQAAGHGQEAVLQLTETPEQTQARQQSAAEEAQRDPLSTSVGALVAPGVFFGPSLGNIAKAMTGNKVALQNVLTAGGIGAGMEVVSATAMGNPIEAKNVIAGGVFNMLMSEPNRLGRRLGFPTDFIPDAAKPTGPGPRIGGDAEPTSDVGTIAGMRQRAGMPRVTAEPVVEPTTTPAEATPVGEVGAPVPVRGGESKLPEKVFRAMSEAELTEALKTGAIKSNSSMSLPIEKSLGLTAFGSSADDVRMYENVNRQRGGKSYVVEVEPSPDMRPDWTELPELRKQRDEMTLETSELRETLKREGDSWENAPMFKDWIAKNEADLVALNKRLEGMKTEAQLPAKGAKLPYLQTPNPVEVSRIKKITEVSADGEKDVTSDFLGKPPVVEQAPAPETPVIPPTEPPPPDGGGVPPARPAGEPAPENLTTIRNKVVDAERVARGEPPMDAVEPVGNAEFFRQAREMEAADPRAAARLVDELAENPRTIEPVEQVLLMRERQRLKSEWNSAAQRVLEAKKAGDVEAEANANADLEAANKQLLYNETVTGRGGGASTNVARSLQIRQAFMAEDFTPAQMALDLQMKQGGEPLSKEQMDAVQKQSEAILRTDAELQKIRDAAEKQKSAEAIDAKIAETTAKNEAAVDPAVRTLTERIIARLDTAAKNAEKSLRSRLANLGSAPDPLIVLDVAKIAAARTAKASIEFAQWSAEMISKWGEKIRPFLQPGWDQRDQHIDTAIDAGAGTKKKEVAAKIKAPKVPLDAPAQQARVEAAIGKRIKEGKGLNSIIPFINRLQDSFIAQGVTEREALIDAVHGALKQHDPAITRDETMEVMSKYGQSTPLSKDPVKMTRREVDGQIQQMLKLRDISEGTPLPKSGPERPVPGPVWRNLIKAVNAAKKKFGVKVTNPETQLKSTLDGVKTRLNNSIEDMALEIETGVKRPDQTEIEYTQEIAILQAMKGRLQSTLRDIDGPKTVSEEARIAAAKRGLEVTIAMKQRRLAGEEARVKKGVSTPEIEALRAESEALTAQLAEVNAADAVLKENRKAEGLVRQIEATEELLTSNTAKASTQTADTQLVAEAKAQLRGLREQLAEKRANDPQRQLEAIEKTEQALEASIRKLDAELESGTTAPLAKKTAAQSERIEYLKAQKDALLKLRTQLRNEARPKLAPEELKLKARMTYLRNAAADLRRRTAAGEFTRAERQPVDLSKNPEAVKLAAEHTKARREHEDAKFLAEQAQRKNWQKLTDKVSEVLGASRPVLASTDISAPGRQGSFLLFGDLIFNPKRAFRQLKKMFQQGVSEKTHQEQQAAIKLRPNAEFYEQDGLRLTSLDGQLSAREEHQMSNLAEKIPGLGKAVVRPSNRAYSGFMNEQSVDAYDAMANWLGGRQNMNKDTAEFMAAAINDFTGRGNIKDPRGKIVSNFLAKYLFSPRFWLSNMSKAVGRPVWRGIVRDVVNGNWKNVDPKARLLVAGQYAKWMSAVVAMGGLATLAGGSIEWDPRSADFLKLKFGDKRYDIGGGMGSLITFMSQVISGKRKVKGKLEKVRHDGGTRPQVDAGQLWMRYERNKLAPIPGAAYDIARGIHPSYEDVTPLSIIQNTTIPIPIMDTYKFFKRDNPASALKDTIINMTGVTVKDYGDR